MISHARECITIGMIAEGDSIMAHKRSQRVKGVVKRVDFRTRTVFYETSGGGLSSSNIYDVFYLDGPRKDWI